MPIWSDDEIATLGAAAFRRETLKCPRCKARVDEHFIATANQSTEDVLLRCERCGANGHYNTEHLAAMSLQWNLAQKRHLSDQYWEHKFARCPNDRAVIHFHEIRSVGSNGEFLARCPHCGRGFQSRDLIDAESFEAKYTVLGHLGKGGMGQVDRVRRHSDGQEFAAKRILPQFLRKPEMVQRFQRETRICRQIRHPNVVSLHEDFIDEHGGVLILDLLTGGTLLSCINNSASTMQSLAHYFSGVVEGLLYLHRSPGGGVVHRDLKPANILISADGRACIADLGLARLVERDSPTLTGAAMFLGTQHYMAPEQIGGAGNVTYKADIYSLGVIAYEIATRCSPNTLVHLEQLRPSLADTIRACLNRDPAGRPDDGRTLAAELSSAAST